MELWTYGVSVVLLKFFFHHSSYVGVKRTHCFLEESVSDPMCCFSLKVWSLAESLLQFESP